jgi:hypothetical protein
MMLQRLYQIHHGTNCFVDLETFFYLGLVFVFQPNRSTTAKWISLYRGDFTLETARNQTKPQYDPGFTSRILLAFARYYFQQDNTSMKLY